MHLYPMRSEGTGFRGPQSWKNSWSKVQSVGGILLQLQVGCVKLRCWAIRGWDTNQTHLGGIKSLKWGFRKGALEWLKDFVTVDGRWKVRPSLGRKNRFSQSIQEKRAPNTSFGAVQHWGSSQNSFSFQETDTAGQSHQMLQSSVTCCSAQGT